MYKYVDNVTIDVFDNCFQQYFWYTSAQYQKGRI